MLKPNFENSKYKNAEKIKKFFCCSENRTLQRIVKNY